MKLKYKNKLKGYGVQDRCTNDSSGTAGQKTRAIVVAR